MARLVFPFNVGELFTLFRNVKNKVDADGPGGELTTYFSFNKINLQADQMHIDEAATQHQKAEQFAKIAEEATAARNLLKAKIDKQLRAMYAFLKQYYSPNYSLVGLWGAPITTKGRIDYPKNFLEFETMFRQLTLKYASYGGEPTPLDPWLANAEVSIDELSDWMQEANVQHGLSQERHRKKEECYASRNRHLNKPVKNIRNIAGYLMKLHADNPSLLGAYGFTVESSEKLPRRRTSSIGFNRQKTIYAIQTNSEIINMGSIPLEIHKGRKLGKKPIVLPPNSSLTLAAGYSVITVFNPNTLVSGVISTLCWH